MTDLIQYLLFLISQFFAGGVWFLSCVSLSEDNSKDYTLFLINKDNEHISNHKQPKWRERGTNYLIFLRGINKCLGRFSCKWYFFFFFFQMILFFKRQDILTVNPKGDQSWISFGKTDANAEAPILWPPDVKSWLIGKDPDAVKDWGQEEKGARQDEMVGWHHRLSVHESEQALGDGEGQGSLVCCSPWGCQQLDMTEWLNNKF